MAPSIAGPLYRPAAALFCAALIISPLSASAQGQVNVDANKAAERIVRVCDIVSKRIDKLVDDEWGTQDLRDLASVWAAMGCHQVLGVGERSRFLVPNHPPK